MKYIFTFLFLFFTYHLSLGQIFPVTDKSNNEIYGYVTFSIIEKSGKKENLYLISLMDINLNNVAQTTFKDKESIKIRDIHFNGKVIFFEVISGSVGNKEWVSAKDYSYRLYDVSSNLISPRYELEDQDKNLYIKDSYPIKEKGFGLILYHDKTFLNQVYALDHQNEQLYSFKPYEDRKKKTVEIIHVGDVNNELLVLRNRKYPQKKSKEPRTTLSIHELFSGTLINEVSLDTPEINVDITNVQIIDDELIVFGDSYELKKALESSKTSGLIKARVSHSGEVQSQEQVVWANLQSLIDIKEGGFVKKKGFIYTHKYVLDKHTGNTVVVSEYVKGSLAHIKVEDFLFLEFDSNFKPIQAFEVETTPSFLNLQGYNVKGSRAYVNTLKRYNYFDFRFSNFLEDESGLSFFYFNYEKVRLFQGNDISHGMIVYKDGKFTANKLQWRETFRGDNTLNLLPSKPGYILLSIWDKNKGLENRLERLVY